MCSTDYVFKNKSMKFLFDILIKKRNKQTFSQGTREESRLREDLVSSHRSPLTSRVPLCLLDSLSLCSLICKVSSLDATIASQTEFWGLLYISMNYFQKLIGSLLWDISDSIISNGFASSKILRYKIYFSSLIPSGPRRGRKVSILIFFLFSFSLTCNYSIFSEFLEQCFPIEIHLA